LVGAVGIEIMSRREIDRVYAAFLAGTSFQSLLNITMSIAASDSIHARGATAHAKKRRRSPEAQGTHSRT